MRKIIFKNKQLKIIFLLLFLATLFVFYNFYIKTLVNPNHPQRLFYIGYLLLGVSLFLLYFKYNFVKYNHEELVLKINQLKRNRFSFNSIRKYELEDNKLFISLRDSSHHQFNLKSVESQDIERLEDILDEHVHNYL